MAQQDELWQQAFEKLLAWSRGVKYSASQNTTLTNEQQHATTEKASATIDDQFLNAWFDKIGQLQTLSVPESDTCAQHLIRMHGNFLAQTNIASDFAAQKLGEQGIQDYLQSVTEHDLRDDDLEQQATTKFCALMEKDVKNMASSHMAQEEHMVNAMHNLIFNLSPDEQETLLLSFSNQS